MTYEVIIFSHRNLPNHSVHLPFVLGGATTPPPHLSVGGVEPPTKFSKRGEGLTESQFLEEGCWERGGDIFQGGLQFLHKKIK